MDIDRLPVPALYVLFSFFIVSERKVLLGTYPECDSVLQITNKHTTSLWVYSNYSKYPYQKRFPLHGKNSLKKACKPMEPLAICAIS